MEEQISWEALFVMSPSLQGITCSKLKHKNKVWKLFKIKNEDTRTMSMASF